MKLILTIALSSISAATLLAQDTTGVIADSVSVSRVAPYRDPHRALILGIVIPGAGQFYAGEYLRGYLALVTTGGGLAMGPLVFSMDGCTFAFLSDCHPGPKWPYEVLGAYMIAGAVWTWVSTARDAPHAAERANRRHRVRTGALAPFIQPSPVAPGRWNTGVAVRW
jgi:TM2 domain-containing membrane protein YozV